MCLKNAGLFILLRVTIDKDITWFHKLAVLKLAKECNEALFKLTAEGPSVMHVNFRGEIGED